MNQVPQDVSFCLQNLDKIQNDIFDIFTQIINVSDPSQALENESIDFTRSKLSKQGTENILKFENFLDILKVKLNNIIEIYDSDDDRLRVVYEIYKEKLSNLKNELKQTELKSYRLEEEFIHKQRMERFGKVPERQKTFEEMKNELFAGKLTNNVEKDLQQKSNEQKLMETNKSITSSLQGTRQLMTTTILKSELNIDELDQQQKDLNSFNGLLSELNETLKSSKNIVKFIEKQDRLDKNRIYLSIGFLMICCAWVIWRRILKLPVTFFLWSMFKIFRIFKWLLPTESPESLIESQIIMGTVSAISMATAISSTSTSLSSSISTAFSDSLDKEIVMDIEDDSKVKTWEEILKSTTTEIIKDEL